MRIIFVSKIEIGKTKKIQFAYGHNIAYLYDSGGNKRQTVHTTVKSNLNVPMGTTNYTPPSSQVQYQLTTDYCGHILYENGAIRMIRNSEGYVTKEGTTNNYNYYERDYLGNNRLVIRTTSSSYTYSVQAMDYYPFGLPINRNATAEQENDQLFKFGDKVYDEMFGLNQYDQGARFFGAEIPITPTPDPLAEKYPNMSPYCQWGNNPVRFVDPDGRFPILVPLIKGAVGAITDAIAQVSVSMANEQSFKEAISNIDYTSVGASFVTGVLTVPGMSTVAKTLVGTAIAADAAVDFSNNSGVETVISGDKTLGKAAVDAAASILPGKAVDGVTSSFNKAVSGDLGANSAATMTKETKSILNQAQTTVNSTAVQAEISAVSDYTGKLVGGQANGAIDSNPTGRVSAPIQDPLVQPADATRIKKPEIYLMQ